jgi:hypothetical protein
MGELTGSQALGDAAIHYSAVSPVMMTKCGLEGVRASSTWSKVTCLACLVLGAKHDRKALEALKRHEADELDKK